MGRDIPPPEQADTWGEYRARLEWESANQPGLRSVVWRVVAVLLFVTGLLFCGYALTYSHWWQWLGALVAFAVFGLMVTRAVRTMEREGKRAVLLDQLDREWQAHLKRGSPTR